jgi:hypothetical protein
VSEEKRRAGKKWLKPIMIFAAVIVVLVAAVLFILRGLNRPIDYADIIDHFKYGSIGSEAHNGIPYWVWKVLPDMFPEKLPGKGYESLGFIREEGRDTPIGFSIRRAPIALVGLNCAVCHTGTIRDSPSSPPRIVVAMPANLLNLQGYIRFLMECARDERFSPRYLMPAIEGIGGNLNFIERFIYRNVAIYRTRDALIAQHAMFRPLFDTAPPWGPGRVDTFNPYKALQFHWPMSMLPASELVGAADLPSIWNQRPRQGMQLHWDGNNTLVEERNMSAALGAGVTPTSIDLKRMKRLEDWLLDFPAPRYPYPINEELAATGRRIYEQNCAACHDFGAPNVGTVVRIEDIGTDPHRLDSYTYEFLSNQNTLFAGYPWRFRHFRKTDGYANQPLDGIWLRAPYLHNGSVPTLRNLLDSPEQRPKRFYRGYDVYDPVKVGFVSDVPNENGREFFLFDTSQPGNSNSGHVYGTDLNEEEKTALVEYMKRL